MLEARPRGQEKGVTRVELGRSCGVRRRSGSEGRNLSVFEVEVAEKEEKKAPGRLEV